MSGKRKLLHVTVTQEHIDRGQRRDGWRCPLARALTEFAREGKVPAPANAVACVGRATAMILDGETGAPVALLWLPRDAQRFVAAYDRGVPVAPIEFDVETVTYVSSTWP
jgi:hypothetical protein